MPLSKKLTKTTVQKDPKDPKYHTKSTYEICVFSKLENNYCTCRDIHLPNGTDIYASPHWLSENSAGSKKIFSSINI